MSKPMIHAMSSAKRFGGVPEDYLPLHQFMDSSKSAHADNRHRALTHNAWFIGTDGPLERAFGPEFLVPREGDEGAYFQCQEQIEKLERELQGLRQMQRKYARSVSTRDLGEQHVLEDFQMRFIPSASDYINEMRFQAWMDNGNRGTPPSMERIEEGKVTRRLTLTD